MLSLREELKATLVGILLWIPLLPIFIPSLIINLLVSHVVQLLAKLFHPELIPITKSDAFSAYAPSNTPASYAYTCQIWRVKGIIEVDALRNHFYNCFLSTEEDRTKYRNLYCLFVEYLGYIFKKRLKQIDLAWHIQEHQLPEGESVEQFVGKWMVTHDRTSNSGEAVERPIWMIKVIQNRNLQETNVVFKLHHGICDGYTIVHLSDKLSGNQSPYLFKQPLPSWPKRIKTLVQFPYQFWHDWYNMYKLYRSNHNFVETNVKQTNIEEQNWMISFGTIDLETVKGIRRVTGTHFVSVMMSIQAGALRRFLQENNSKSRLLKDVPAETYIGHSIGWPNHPVPTKGGGMANHLSLTAIKASIHTEDPLERLLDLDKNFRETNSRGYPLMSYYFMFNVLKHCPAFFVRILLALKVKGLARETGLSTLLGPTNPYYLLGHQVENLWLPVVTPSTFPTMKLVTVPFSHSGIIDVSVNAEAALVKNQATLDRLVKVHFVQELESLRVRCQQLIE